MKALNVIHATLVLCLLGIPMWGVAVWLIVRSLVSCVVVS